MWRVSLSREGCVAERLHFPFGRLRRCLRSTHPLHPHQVAAFYLCFRSFFFFVLLVFFPFAVLDLAVLLNLHHYPPLSWIRYVRISSHRFSIHVRYRVVRVFFLYFFCTATHPHQPSFDWNGSESPPSLCHFFGWAVEGCLCACT